MDRTPYTDAERTTGTQGRYAQLSEPTTRSRPRPVLWNGSRLERDCAEFVPVLWDGSCLD
jgi:hypothetical protein